MKIKEAAAWLAILLITGCSSGNDQASGQAGGDHVWKEQVETMDKAKAVEKTVMDAAAKQAEAVEQQSE
ncbi:MAG TPA: hypothetical protein VIC61_02225 [Gammaproteobacteria bacterium]